MYWEASRKVRRTRASSLLCDAWSWAFCTVHDTMVLGPYHSAVLQANSHRQTIVALGK